MPDYELKFLDGPAKDDRIHMVVPPSQKRWHCRSARASWWVIDTDPPEDPTVVVTEYEVVGSAPRKDGGALVCYGMVSDAE